MDLEIVNDVLKAVKGADDTFAFVSELKNYVEQIKDNKQKDENLKIEKQKKIEKEKEKQSNLVYVPLEKIKSKTNSNEIEDVLLNSSKVQGKITTKFRDEMLQERRKILEIYAKNTAEKGEMYYIYNKEELDLNEGVNHKINTNGDINHKINESKVLNEDENENQIVKEEKNVVQTEKINNNEKSKESETATFNLTNCSNGKSSIVLKMSGSDLPEGAELGSALRKEGNKFVLDEKATEEAKKAIYSSEVEKLKEQRKFLQSKRIEGHIYQIAEKSDKTAFLFDVTANNENLNQSQEIVIPKEISLNEKFSNNNENETNISNNQNDKINPGFTKTEINNSNQNEAFEEIKFTKKLLNSCNNGDFIIYRDGKYQKY